MLPRRTREWLSRVIEFTLNNAEVNNEQAKAIDDSLVRIIEESPSFAIRDIARAMRYALFQWQKMGNKLDPFGQGHFGLHARTRFYTLAKVLDALLAELAYPSLGELRDKWSDELENR